jgi:hypothetical protein
MWQEQRKVRTNHIVSPNLETANSKGYQMNITCPHCKAENNLDWEGDDEWAQECQSCKKDFIVNAVRTVVFTPSICLCLDCGKQIDEAFRCNECREKKGR